MSFRPRSTTATTKARSLEPGAARGRLTAGMYVPRAVRSDRRAGGRFPRHHRLRADRRETAQGRKKEDGSAWHRIRSCSKKNYLAGELALWQRKEALRKNVIKVDDFPQDFGRGNAAKLAGKLLRSDLTCTRNRVRDRRGAHALLKAKNRPGAFSAGDLATQAGKTCSRAEIRPQADEVIRLRRPRGEVNIGRVAAAHGCGQKVPAGP
jgi:hypothetical protein